MMLVVDRIVEGIVVCEEIETRKIIKLTMAQIPSELSLEIKEGVVIHYEQDQETICIDHKETQKRSARIKALLDDVFE